MVIRRYTREDLTKIAKLFFDTVHSINAKDYTREQLNAWAMGHIDHEKWDASFRQHLTYVAVEGETIVGFGDIDNTGYLDRLYVHKDFQRQGIATALCNRLESETPAPCFLAHASITARPFFEKRGYNVVCRQEVERQGVPLTNYIMKKEVFPKEQ